MKGVTTMPGSQSRPNDPCTMVMFGASGDLAHRKIVPALYNLALDDALPDDFKLVGFSRTSFTDEGFRAEMKEAVGKSSRRKPIDEKVWAEFASKLFYFTGDNDNPRSFNGLSLRLAEIEAPRKEQNRIYYLATPPSFFPVIVEQLAQAKLIAASAQGPWTRVVIEKPFGHDLKTAHELNDIVHASCREDQVYRIDHYLGKETVQNILAFRLGNAIFEPLWNCKYVDNVQICVAESIGIEGRGAYYEEAGALRDIVQNHMLQLLALTAMEPPGAFDADAVRSEKFKVLQAVAPLREDEVDKYTVRGQYLAGVADGKPLLGYRQEKGVAPDSTTPTYVAMRLMIQNWRWAGVPFYLRTGKRMPQRVTEIAIQYQAIPHVLFRGQDGKAADRPNVLILRIQPDEGIALRFATKLPGEAMRLTTETLEFSYSKAFGGEPREAYERLLLDVMLGDPTLFPREDEVEASWRIVDPVLKAWEQHPGVHAYASGSWGPGEANALVERDGREWWKY
jgi:glucose-6-phosphate 1-dehydrogenase